MAIGRPKANDDAPQRGMTAKEDFLASRGMSAKPAGEESATPLLRSGGRGASRLRRDHAIEEAERSGWTAIGDDALAPMHPPVACTQVCRRLALAHSHMNASSPSTTLLRQSRR
ncbi:hypothetical protein C1M53_15340 [Mesorhizobium sp. Pch-S]|nr:hypothetical protein C1M53_15340 [Mesorhizobium sp. Pch-S]